MSSVIVSEDEQEPLARDGLAEPGPILSNLCQRALGSRLREELRTHTRRPIPFQLTRKHKTGWDRLRWHNLGPLG